MSIYVVIDVEFDGPQPGLNSMISLGAVAINKNGDNFGDFEINLAPVVFPLAAPPSQLTINFILFFNINFSS